MARIDYAVSVSAIGSGTVEGQTVERVDQRVNRTLSGGNSSFTWAGTDTSAWSTAGVHTHKEAWTTAQTVGASGDNMIWIKHTGKLFDSGTASSTDEAEPVKILIERTVTHAEMNTTGVQLADGDGNVTLTGGTAVVDVEIASLLSGEAMVITLPQGTIKIKSTKAQAAGPAVEYGQLT